MSYRTRILYPARLDLDRQADYYDEQQAGLGQRFLDGAELTIAQIGRQPGLSARYGFRVAKLEDVRARPIASFPRLLVFYRVVTDVVQILRVIHGAQDIDAMTDEILPE